MEALELKDANRRELLSWLFSAPFATLACRRTPKRAYDGGIVGEDASVGHLLRKAPPPSPTSTRRVPILIVGGGVAGLSAAWRLTRAGVSDFELLELGDALGGTSRSGKNEVSAYPWGAHYVPCPLPHAKALSTLLVEAGAAQKGKDGLLVFDETQLCRAPQERLFMYDRWYEGLYPSLGASAEDVRQLQLFWKQMATWAAQRDGAGRRAFAVPMAYGSDDAEVVALDRFSMAQWMAEAGFTSARLRWFVEYGCRDDYGASLNGTSAWAGIHYFASRMQRGHSQEVLTWPEGNARLCHHLAKSVSGRHRTGVLVTRLAQGAMGPRGRPLEVWTYEPKTGRAERLIADEVILALPQHVVARLLDFEEAAERRADAKAFQTSPWLVANLTLKRMPLSRGFPSSWDNVLYQSPGLGYVVATHQLDKLAGANQSVWTYYLPFVEENSIQSRQRLLALSFEEAADAIVADLSRAHPNLGECLERIDIWRWGHAMTRPRPRFVFSEARRRAAASIGNLHFAHTDLSAIPLFDEAQYQGVRAAETILKSKGIAFPSLL